MANGGGSAGVGLCPRAAAGPPRDGEAPGAQREGSRAGGITPNLRGWGCLRFPKKPLGCPRCGSSTPGMVLSPPPMAAVGCPQGCPLHREPGPWFLPAELRRQG